MTSDACKLECKKNRWCKGIRIKEGTLTGQCRLLTETKVSISGWTFYNEGNWAEPENWQELGSTRSGYVCYAKLVGEGEVEGKYLALMVLHLLCGFLFLMFII